MCLDVTLCLFRFIGEIKRERMTRGEKEEEKRRNGREKEEKERRKREEKEEKEGRMTVSSCKGNEIKYTEKRGTKEWKKR